jgi:hypothetical protein
MPPLPLPSPSPSPSPKIKITIIIYYYLTLTFANKPKIKKPLLITPSTILYTSCTEYTPNSAPPASTPTPTPTPATPMTMSYVTPTPTKPAGGNVVVTGTGILPSMQVMYTGAGGRKGVSGLFVVGVGMLVGGLVLGL